MTLPDMPAWGTSPTADKVKPGAEFAAEGYKAGDKPSRQHFNWIFYSFYQLCQAINNGELKDFAFYSDIATVKAINTTGFTNRTSIYIKNYGCYFLDVDATLGDIKPTTGPGYWIFAIPDFNSTVLDLHSFLSEHEHQLSLIKGRITELEEEITNLKGNL